MDQETPSFVPPFQVRSYRHHRKQQMRAFDADQEQRRAKATRVYDAHERQRMEERTGKPGRRYIPMDDASRYVVYVERGHFTDIPIFVPRGLEKRYLDFRNLALHGFDEDQLQRRQRALWIFDEDERTMKARDQRTRDKSGLPPVPDPNDMPQSLYCRPFSRFDTVGYGIVERPREQPRGAFLLNSLNQRDNMRAAIGFWTWLGREEGTLQTNEVNSHTPTNRRKQVIPNPRPNRVATFPPTLEENETELDRVPDIPRINPTPRDNVTDSPPPRVDASEHEGRTSPIEMPGPIPNTTDRPDKAQRPPRTRRQTPSPDDVRGTQGHFTAGRNRYPQYGDECLQGMYPQPPIRGQQRAKARPLIAKGPRARGHVELNPPRVTRGRRW